MPARKARRVKQDKNSNAKKSTVPLNRPIGIIAGAGALPKRLIDECREQEREFFVVAFEGQTDTSVLDGCNYMLTRLGAAGQIINTLRAHQITDLVLIGAIRRPAVQELKPDWRSFNFFMRVGVKALGDDGLLKALRSELEKEGFKIHGVQNFIPDLMATKGVYTRTRPKKSDVTNIVRGIEVARALGSTDVGQSVIVQEGIVLGIEAIEGTDELIRRTAALKRKGRGGVLVKLPKQQQDHDLDLPTIGPETLRQAIAAGLSGIAIEAGKTIVIDPQEVAELANTKGLFVTGIDADNFDQTNTP